MDCDFCKIAKGEKETYLIFKNNFITAFLDYDPINEGHILIVPNNHYLDADEIPENILSEITLLSKKAVKVLKEIYHPDGYTIMQNGGIFNDVGHYHLHIFPRYKNDKFGWTYNDKECNYSKDIADKIKINLNNTFNK